MPQLNKGGKYVFGLSVIGKDNKIWIPNETLINLDKQERKK